MNNFYLTSSNDSGTDTIHFNKLHAALLLLALTLAMFSDVLFFNTGQVLSKAGMDLYNGEMFGYDFLFRCLQDGKSVLWNHYIFGGAPTLSTPFYPPLFSFLFFDPPLAVNIAIALHVFLIGFFMYLWTNFRGLHPLACLASSIIIMFSGPCFMHVYAGHLTNIAAMTWVPLIFLSLDVTLDRPTVPGVMLGIFAVSMQILTGQFQYVYYTAIACALYAGIRLPWSDRKVKTLVGMMFIVLGSLAICSFHLFNSILAMQESVRTAGVSFQFSSMFSFPPENLLTLLTPFFFGEMSYLPYWGRCYLWEMSVFMGITGLITGIYGAFYGKEKNRWLFGILVIVFFVLALGAHTPLFQFLYHWLPGFNKFRGTSKFIFLACLFLSMLSAIGLDSLLKHNQVHYRFLIGIIAIGIMLLGAAYLISANQNIISNIMHYIAATKESYLPHAIYIDPPFLHYAKNVSVFSFLVAGLICLLLAFLLFYVRRSGKAIYIIMIIALIEVFSFARLNRPTFNIHETMIDTLTQFHFRHPGTYRVLNRFNPNMGMSTGTEDIWGYGPVAQMRYVQFMAYTQGKNPDNADTYLRIENYHRLFSMLRLRYIISGTGNGLSFQETADYMPRLNLIQDWTVVSTRDAIFQEMDKTNFNPRKLVILEKDPGFSPATSGTNAAGGVIESPDDSSLIKVDSPVPAMLLITDNYSKGWRATPLPGSTQSNYQIMPANYTLMAIPLNAGRHYLRLEYKPAVYVIGKWISLASLAIYLSVIMLLFWKSRRGLRFFRK